ncbi:MAG: hypothetical protein LBB18_00935 [Puniceicoccales bacterium]|jgi:hypothetical protein|nr:hypothetical protein [Puniceicoccales bacterium]
MFSSVKIGSGGEKWRDTSVGSTNKLKQPKVDKSRRFTRSSKSTVEVNGSPSDPKRFAVAKAEKRLRSSTMAIRGTGVSKNVNGRTSVAADTCEPDSEMYGEVESRLTAIGNGIEEIVGDSESGNVIPGELLKQFGKIRSCIKMGKNFFGMYTAVEDKDFDDLFSAIGQAIAIHGASSLTLPSKVHTVIDNLQEFTKNPKVHSIFEAQKNILLGFHRDLNDKDNKLKYSVRKYGIPYNLWLSEELAYVGDGKDDSYCEEKSNDRDVIHAAYGSMFREKLKHAKSVTVLACRNFSDRKPKDTGDMDGAQRTISTGEGKSAVKNSAASDGSHGGGLLASGNVGTAVGENATKRNSKDGYFSAKNLVQAYDAYIGSRKITTNVNDLFVEFFKRIKNGQYTFFELMYLLCENDVSKFRMFVSSKTKKYINDLKTMSQESSGPVLWQLIHNKANIIQRNSKM